MYIYHQNPISLKQNLYLYMIEIKQKLYNLIHNTIINGYDNDALFKQSANSILLSIISTLICLIKLFQENETQNKEELKLLTKLYKNFCQIYNIINTVVNKTNVQYAKKKLSPKMQYYEHFITQYIKTTTTNTTTTT